MEITSVTRKVSGFNYSNISFTANLSEGEDPVKIAKELDKLCHDSLKSIREDEDKEMERENKENRLLTQLENMKEMVLSGKWDDLPF